MGFGGAKGGSAMCEVPVFYATTDGQTSRIAEYLAGILRERGLDSRAIDLAAAQAPAIDWGQVRAVILGASLHAGRHQDAATVFARAQHDRLNARPSAFFSVSLSAASQNATSRAAAERLAKGFASEAGWEPQTIACVAGRLAYTRYGWLKRLVMKRISRKEGGPTDTSRDHEMTDWPAVRRLALTMADAVAATGVGAGVAAGAGAVLASPAR
jgi:menaquinone-dependent protoporphyrinogen oxidase